MQLFERRGTRGGYCNSPAYGCWCMYWRDRKLGHGAPKKRAMAALARAGGEPGLLAYEDGKPIGWVSVAPREEFRALLASPQYRPAAAEPGIWSIVCFLVDRSQRRRGMAAALLAAAVDHAFTRGAAAVEAYPHRANKSDYMGCVALYEKAGFKRVRDAKKRAIYRRSARVICAPSRSARSPDSRPRRGSRA